MRSIRNILIILRFLFKSSYIFSLGLLFVAISFVSPSLAQNEQTFTGQVSNSSDNVNEDGANFESNLNTIWLGTGSSTTNSYTGLRFTNVTVPQGSTITSAHLEVYSPQAQWIRIRFNLYANVSDNSPIFLTNDRPSQRPLTVHNLSHSSNSQWVANTWYSLPDISPVIQEVINRPGWQNGNSLSIILKGQAAQWGRKFVSSYASNPTLAPKLVITYTPNGPIPTSTPTPTPPPTPGSWSSLQIQATGEPLFPVMAWNGNGYGALYSSNNQLIFIKLDSDGHKLSESVVATAPSRIWRSNIVWDGVKFGVVWSSSTPASNLRFATLDINGNLLSNIPLTTDSDGINIERPALIWTGSEYVVIWSGKPDIPNQPFNPHNIISLSKIASDGQTINLDRKLAINSSSAAGNSEPIVAGAWNGTNFGLAWLDVRETDDSNNTSLYFASLDSEGNKLGPEVKVSNNGLANSTNIFARGNNFNLIWTETYPDRNSSTSNLYFTEVDLNGGKLLLNKNLNTKGDYETRAMAVKNNNTYQIIWESLGSGDLYFKSIDSQGNILADNIPVTTQAGNDNYPFITTNGVNNGAVWLNSSDIVRLFFGRN